MKIGPFKMKGFSGFKDESPVKHNDQGMFASGGLLGKMTKNRSTGESKPMMAVGSAASAMGSSIRPNNNRTRKGGGFFGGMGAIDMVKKNSKNRMGALDMFSGFKNFF